MRFDPTKPRARMQPFGLVMAAVLAAACGPTPGPPVDDDYDTCNQGDDCADGLDCLATTLPASTGFTGLFCTSTCNTDSDCLQVPTSFAAACVNNQCYLTCPSNDACPFGQSCLSFTDQNGNPISLCTP